MSCILRLAGDDIDIDLLLSNCPVEPVKIYQKGVPQSNRPNARKWQKTGLNVLVPDAEFDAFQVQKLEAISFLTKYLAPIAELRAVQGVTVAELDFGIERRNVQIQSDTFEAKLVSLAAQLNLDIKLSQYSIGSNAKRRK